MGEQNKNMESRVGSGAVELLYEVERHLRRTGTPPANFGRAALNDPSFVRDMRRGREPRAKTVARVRAYIAAQEQPR